MNKSRQRVYAHVKQDRFILVDCDSVVPWAGSADVSALVATDNHREGSAAISFAKSGVTQTVGTISRTYDSDEQPNLVEYYDDGELSFWINLSSLTNVASVSITIGESAADNYIYTVADTGLTTGWQKLTFDVSSPSSTTGDGAAWSSIGYIAVTVTFDSNANTLADILVDAISIKYTISTNVENIAIDGSGLATEAKQDAVIAAIASLETASGIDDGVTTVTTAGTDVPLAASTACVSVTIQAQTDNTGLIAVGGAGVDATIATGTGNVLEAGDAITIDIDNLSKVYIDATVSGDGVRYTYLT